MVKNRNKYLFKNTFIFALSNFSTKLIIFFLIPLYTWKLTTTEYGIVDLLFTLCNFIYPLLTLNIVEAVFRFSFDKDIEKEKIINLGLICSTICLIIGLIFIPIIGYFDQYRDYALLFYIHLSFLALTQILLSFLKGQEKLKLFAIGNIVNTMCVAALSLLFLLCFDLKIEGYFLSYIFANVITILFVVVFGKIKIRISKKFIDKDLYITMLKYSIVLMPTTFLWWIVNSSDKIMITYLIGAAANGIYAISYKFPSLLTMVGAIFNQAWVFSAINEKDSNDYEKYTNNVFNKLFLTLTISAMGLLVIIKPLLSIYVSNSYYSSWKYVPYLAAGYIFMTSATFLSASYNVHKDSKGFLFSALVGAISNIILNITLIPFFGIHGAAFSTMISYIIVFVYRLLDTRKYVKLSITKYHLLLIVLVAIVFCLTYFTSIYFSFLQILLLLITIFVYRTVILDVIKEILKLKR